jgi:hypothetical protein
MVSSPANPRVGHSTPGQSDDHRVEGRPVSSTLPKRQPNRSATSVASRHLTKKSSDGLGNSLVTSASIGRLSCRCGERVARRLSLAEQHPSDVSAAETAGNG